MNQMNQDEFEIKIHDLRNQINAFANIVTVLMVKLELKQLEFEGDDWTDVIESTILDIQVKDGRVKIELDRNSDERGGV
uniref:Uncharacterized protein n=1 Tax=viral metagenome TaxID=1070528 RepID=A0A6M3IZW1_9ZZZZ